MYLSPFGTGQDLIDGTGSVRAAKRRCPMCGTSKLRSRGDGRVMCKNGHEQAGMIEEVTEAMADSTTRRHTKKQKRESKRQIAQNKRIYGRDAQFLILQVMQHILKEQATALVEELGAPGSVLGTVRNLWLLYVSKLGEILVPGMDDEDLAEQTLTNRTFKKSKVTETQSALTKDNKSDSLYSQQLTESIAQTQEEMAEYDNGYDDGDLAFLDDSLNSLLQKIDDDIARDELEMLDIEEFRAENSRSKQKDQAVSEDGEQADELEEQLDELPESEFNAHKRQATSKNHSKLAQNSIYRGLLRHIENFVHLEYLPAILYLSFLWLRLPLTHADLFRLLADERVPYASAYKRLPEELTERIGRGFMGFVILKFSPTVTRLRTITRGFQIFFQKHYDIRLSPVDTPVMLLHLIRRLGLGIEIYMMAMRLLELVDIEKMRFNSHRTKLELNAMSAIIVVLKLHYGLDEIERQPSEPEAIGFCRDLPPLNVFLRKWREDWKQEMLISTTPELSTVDSDWEAEFAKYCRRKMTKRKTAGNRAVYLDIAPRFRRIIESLAYDGGLDTEKARKLLPSQYLPGSQQNDPSEESKTNRVPEVLRCIEPILIPRVGRQIEKESDKTLISRYPSEYKTLFEPYDNHPEIKLNSGELYTTKVGAESGISANGYMIPTLGLVIARCADVIGYSRHAVLNSVSALEFCICRVKDA